MERRVRATARLICRSLRRHLEYYQTDSVFYNQEVGEGRNVRNGAWRNEILAPYIQPLPISASRHTSAESEEIRALLKD